MFCEDFLGMFFWKFREGFLDVKIFMGSFLYNCLGVGDICYDFCFI